MLQSGRDRDAFPVSFLLHLEQRINRLLQGLARSHISALKWLCVANGVGKIGVSSQSPASATLLQESLPSYSNLQTNFSSQIPSAQSRWGALSDGLRNKPSL